MTTSQALITIGIVALCTLLTRALPFLLFPAGKQTPAWALHLGKTLPYAVIGMLIVYCLKDIQISGTPYGIPETLALAVVAALHLWKRKTLLSIGAGTAVYMLLVQAVFHLR